MMNEQESITIKKSELVLQLSLKRTNKGLLVEAKTSRAMEDAFREWAQGTTQPPGAHGRLWESPTGDPLPEVYTVGWLAQDLRTADGTPYRLDRTGTPLMSDYGPELGFLRFVGISEGSGVSFLVKGMYSTDKIRDMAKALKAGAIAFYTSFLKPIDVVITMSSTEI